MTATVPYVRERDGVYQYERRVPARIQRDQRRFAEAFGSRVLFRRSLGTKNAGAMFDAARQVHEQFERLIADGPVLPVVVKRPSPSVRIVTDNDLQAIADRYCELTADPFERLHRRANIDPAAAEELDRLEYELEQDAASIRSAIRERHNSEDGLVLKPSDEARHVVVENGFAAPEGSEQLGAIIGAVRSGMERGYARIAALANGEVAPALPRAAQSSKPTLRLTLAEAVDRYLEARKPPPKALSETKLALRQFEEVAGRKLLSAITREDVHGFVQHMSDQKVGGKSPGSVIRHLSIHSVSKRLRMLGAAINHAIDNGWLTTDNPMGKIKVAAFAKAADKAVMPDKRRLQVSELNLIFQHPWFTGCKSPTETHVPGRLRLQGCEYWAPVVAVLTGCRASELGGMRIADVQLDDPHPHLIIRDNQYRRTKSRKTRCVPILDVLLELGFADYVRRITAAGADRLFPDWTARIAKSGEQAGYPLWSNARVIRAFNRTVIPTMLGEKLAPGVRQEVTFHSLRGSFKALLGVTSKLPTNIVHEVIGHAKSELDESYIGSITIEESYPAVHGCRYGNLVIPDRQPQQ